MIIKKRYFINSILAGSILYGCAVKIDRFKEIQTKEDKKLYVISDLRFKTFVLNDDRDSIFINTPFEKGFKKMVVRFINRNNEYTLKISDFKYYKRIKTDTIVIKRGNKLEKYVQINSE